MDWNTGDQDYIDAVNRAESHRELWMKGEGREMPKSVPKPESGLYWNALIVIIAGFVFFAIIFFAAIITVSSL